MDTRLHEDAAKLSAIDALGANFGVMAIPEKLKEMWLGLLEPYPAAMVNAAVGMVISRYEYKTLPPFAVLKSALDELAGVSEKALELQAIAEWGVLTEQIGKFGYYKKPDLHPTTEHVLRLLGGWADACQWNMKEMDFKRRDFIRLWMDSHGRVEYMQLGAGGVLHALASESDQSRAAVANSGPLHLGSILKSIGAGIQQ